MHIERIKRKKYCKQKISWELFAQKRFNLNNKYKTDVIYMSLIFILHPYER